LYIPNGRALDLVKDTTVVVCEQEPIAARLGKNKFRAAAKMTTPQSDTAIDRAELECVSVRPESVYAANNRVYFDQETVSKRCSWSVYTLSAVSVQVEDHGGLRRLGCTDCRHRSRGFQSYGGRADSQYRLRTVRGEHEALASHLQRIRFGRSKSKDET
jgi:hypothetical protein